MRKTTLIKLTILLSVILVAAILLTGCVSGVSPVGWSGVAIKGTTAYTGSKEGRLVSINLSNNTISGRAEPLKQTAGSGSCYSSSGGSSCGGAVAAIAIYGTPAFSNVPVLGDLVYLAGYNGKIFAYDATSLQQRWVYPVDGYISPIVGALVVSENYIYFGCTDGSVYALDTATGALKWTYTTGGEIWSTPAVGNNTVFIGSFDRNIYALDAATGVLKWTFLTGANSVAPPVVSDGIVYAGSLDRKLYALNVADGKEIWSISGNNWFWAQPVILNGNIYAPCLDNMVYVADARTGAIKTTYDVGGQVASWPTIVNNQVVVATKTGSMWLLPEPNSGTPTSFPIVQDVTSPLGASGNIVYISGPDNYFYGYDVTRGQQIIKISMAAQ